MREISVLSVAVLPIGFAYMEINRLASRLCLLRKRRLRGRKVAFGRLKEPREYANFR